MNRNYFSITYYNMGEYVFFKMSLIGSEVTVKLRFIKYYLTVILMVFVNLPLVV